MTSVEGRGQGVRGSEGVRGVGRGSEGGLGGLSRPSLVLYDLFCNVYTQTEGLERGACIQASGGGGGHSGTERLPTAKRPRRAEAVNGKI